MRPLEGIRVLDLTRALAGPYCTMMLGDLGADVVKVERPGQGDESRGWGPPFVGAPYGPYPGESTYFIAANRNKRSITVNFKNAEGQHIIRRLASISDVLVENFRTGTLEKMGLGFENLRHQNPGLVYCSFSGYGRTGPYAELPGYDVIIQAEGGMMGITGPEEGPPSRVGVPIIDITAGMFASTAILAALRNRDMTGKGQLVDISLLDASAALLANVASNYLTGGMPHRRLGNAHPNIAPYEAFRARDRWFVMGAANEKQWNKLCEVIEKPELQDDVRFITNTDRVANRAALSEKLNDLFSTQNADDWLANFREAGLPCGPINAIPDVFSHPQAEARDLSLNVEHATAGKVTVTGFPYKFSQTPAEIHHPPPLLGEHTQEVLTDLLECSPEDVRRYQQEGTI